MTISACIKNRFNENDIIVTTDGNGKEITLPSKPGGYGSLINGGELLFLSLAICFCNDVYREAGKRTMEIDRVEVTVSGEFGKEGEPGKNIQYEVRVEAPKSTQAEITALINYVDKIAEVHNTLRNGTSVSLKNSY